MAPIFKLPEQKTMFLGELGHHDLRYTIGIIAKDHLSGDTHASLKTTNVVGIRFVYA